MYSPTIPLTGALKASIDSSGLIIEKNTAEEGVKTKSFSQRVWKLPSEFDNSEEISNTATETQIQKAFNKLADLFYIRDPELTLTLRVQVISE